MSCQILPFPEELRPRLPTIVGNVDYRTLRERLEQIDSLLRLSGLECDFVQRSVERWRKASKRKEPTADEQTKYQERSRRALRCNLLRTLLQEDYRGFSWGQGLLRGFFSAANSKALRETDTFDGMCPRDPRKLRERMKEERFAELQRRRAQTEGRIGILKRGFLGRPMRAKGYANRETALAWGVLTDNLWVVARMMRADSAEGGRRKAA